MNKTIFNIKLINWALMLTALMSTVFWAECPQFMSVKGGSYMFLGIFYTFLFLKVRSFSEQDWADNFFNLKKRLPLLLYMLVMGLLVHRYLETVYWAPKRQKMFEKIQQKYEKAKGVLDKNDK